MKGGNNPNPWLSHSGLPLTEGAQHFRTEEAIKHPLFAQDLEYFKIWLNGPRLSKALKMQKNDKHSCQNHADYC